MKTRQKAALPDNFNDDRSPISGEQVIQRVQQETDTVMLAFSGGKDSIAAWLAVRPHFARVIPFYMYLIPDLKFIEKGLRYFEDYFGTHIMRVPHPSLYRMLNNLVFQAPQNCAVIEAAMLPDFDYDTVTDIIRKELKLPKSMMIATGVRAADSPHRRAAINKYGPINWKRRNFYPVWDMVKDELIALLQQHSIKLPDEYRHFNRSFDGLDYRFLKPIKEHYPDDYQTILEWFPLADLELFRYEIGANRHG